MSKALAESLVAIGTVEGTGADINVPIGFTPRKVTLVNIDDANSLSPMMTWLQGMTEGLGILDLRIEDTAGTGNSSHQITSGAITMWDGEAPSISTPNGYAPGFTIGTNGHINVTGETIVYEATR